jgi:phage anti-repressor protein
MKDRIEQFDFVENQDFVTYSGNTEKGRPSKEYALSLDMAKELSMVERTAKGKQARQYFIECERRAKAPQPDPPQISIPSTRYIEFLELENRDLRIKRADRAILDRAAKEARTDSDNVLLTRFMALYGGKTNVKQFCKQKAIPLSLETVTAAIYRNRKLSALSFTVIATALDFSKKEISAILSARGESEMLLNVLN